MFCYNTLESSAALISKNKPVLNPSLFSQTHAQAVNIFFMVCVFVCVRMCVIEYTLFSPHWGY